MSEIQDFTRELLKEAGVGDYARRAGGAIADAGRYLADTPSRFKRRVGAVRNLGTSTSTRGKMVRKNRTIKDLIEVVRGNQGTALDRKIAMSALKDLGVMGGGAAAASGAGYGAYRALKGKK